MILKISKKSIMISCTIILLNQEKCKLALMTISIKKKTTIVTLLIKMPFKFKVMNSKSISKWKVERILPKIN